MITAGTSFAGYEILEPCGDGAMATTYRALRGDGQEVALKIPKPRFLTDPTFVVRFLQEASLGVRLQHRLIVRTYETGQHDGMPFIVMELIRGMSLRQALATSGTLATRRALQLARDVATSLEYAHAQSVVHRDLKPDNIMLRVGAPLKVLDFGIAKVVGETGLTSANTFIGSPAYSAPEMIDSSTVDHRVDLYALGIILFEMLQGEVPFTGSSPVEVLLKHRSQPFPARDELRHPVAPELWRLVQSLTAKNPDDRLPDARSARIALELLLR
jgi:serine/threonine-protein kinase